MEGSYKVVIGVLFSDSVMRSCRSRGDHMVLAGDHVLISRDGDSRHINGSQSDV